MPWSAAAIGLSGVLGAGASIYAANKQSDAAGNALALQTQWLNNEKPFINLGTNATNSLSALYGFGGKGGGTADYSAFYNSPDYKFAYDQGLQATKNILSAQGGLLSGSGLAGLTNFGQGLASQQYGNYFNRLLQMATMGSSAAGQGIQGAGMVGNTIMGKGQAEASGVVGASNALSGALNSYAGLNFLKDRIGSNPSSYGAVTPWSAAPNGGVPSYGAGGLYTIR